MMGRPQLQPAKDGAVRSAEKRLFGAMQLASQPLPSVTHVSDTVDNSVGITDGGTAAPLTANAEEVSSPVLSDEQASCLRLLSMKETSNCT